MFKKKRKGIFRRKKSSSAIMRPRQTISMGRKRKYIGKKAKYTIYLFIAAFIFIVIYWIYFSPYFLVTNVEMTEKDISQEDLGGKIQTKLQGQIGKNLFTLDNQKLALDTKKMFPELEILKISKNYPNTLEISFNQYPLVANIIHESSSIKKNYIVNSVGYIIKEDLENPNLPYIYMYEDEPANPAMQLLEADKLVYILKSVIYFEDKFGMAIKSVKYLKIPREIHLLTARDFEIWLDIQISAEDQFKKLKKALVKLDIYNENLQYIDLRIAGASGDKIIYKRN